MDSLPSPIQLQFYSLENSNEKITLNLKCPAILYLSPLTIIYINHIELIASNDQGKAKSFLSFSPILVAVCTVLPCSENYPPDSCLYFYFYKDGHQL